ncbi:uncharacterized protein AMSG_03603 [Thecamonas trahens ATCC 50062]|uniref:PDZ domain-containing protein n=1 Tax=Thecamonas trahens ATCC 50062 TaxID=461836 RepID=A0A0L0D4L3_THETB|nr:hypothetical protein AMSG_03603 [Thecamonas trahens ATCC 50062]KNC47175.1 hypothetical protein AMSG_03603 [Thecamonas trahens ATCC 50062]|eukprot:XP_013759949.1 hypothetical protein AMSG_03603 [Thecamonas trahens ATCC 50062]
MAGRRGGANGVGSGALGAPPVLPLLDAVVDVEVVAAAPALPLLDAAGGLKTISFTAAPLTAGPGGWATVPGQGPTVTTATLLPLAELSSDEASDDSTTWRRRRPEALAAASANREAAAALASAASLRARLASLEAVHENSRRREAQARTRLNAALDEIDELNTALYETRRELVAVHEATGPAALEAHALELDAAVAEKTAAEDELAAARASEAALRAQLAKVTEAMAELESEQTKLTAQLMYETGEENFLKDEVARLRAALAHKDSQLEAASKEVDQRVSEIRYELERSRGKCAGLQARLDELELVRSQSETTSAPLLHAPSSAAPVAPLASDKVIAYTEAMAEKERRERKRLVAAREKERLRRLKPEIGLVLDKKMVVTQLTPGKTAVDAGFQVGDRVLKFSGTSVSSLAELGAILAHTAVADVVDVEIARAAAPTQAAEPHDVHRTSSFLTLPLLIGGVGLDLDELHEVLDLIAQTRA